MINFKHFFIEAEQKKSNDALTFDEYIYGLLRYIASSTNTAFLGAVLLRLNVVTLSTSNPKDTSLIQQIWGSPERATLAVDLNGNIFITYQFAKKIGQSILISVLCHEAMHITTYTGDRFFALPESVQDRQLWNIASDAIINRDLRDIGHLPMFKDGIYPNEKGILTLNCDDGSKIIVDTNDKSTEDVYFEIYSAFYKKANQNNQQQKQKDIPVKVGNIVYNKSTNEFGKVTKITGDDVEIEPIDEKDLDKLIK